MVQQPDPRELQRVGSPKTHRLWTPRLQVWGPTSLPGQAQSPAWLGPTLSPPLRGLHPGLYLWAFWGEGRLGGSTPHPPLGVQGCPQDPISQTWRVGWGGDRPRPSSWWQLWGPLSGLLETVPGACGRLEPSGRASSGGELRTRGAPRQSPLSKESASLSLHPGQKQQCRRGRGAGRPRTSLSVCCFHSSQTPDHPPSPRILSALDLLSSQQREGGGHGPGKERTLAQLDPLQGLPGPRVLSLQPPPHVSLLAQVAEAAPIRARGLLARQ